VWSSELSGAFRLFSYFSSLVERSDNPDDIPPPFPLF